MSHKNTLNKSIELVERFAQCLLKDGRSKKDFAIVKQLAPYIEYFSNEIELNCRKDQIFEDYIKMIDEATAKPECDETVKHFEEEIEKAKKQLKNSDKCKEYINFMQIISEFNQDSADGEIETISEIVSTIDPISKLPIVEPVKNKKCGHSYEKSTILQLIDRNPRTRCPIAGCNTTDFVKKSDLVPDTALKRMLSSVMNNSQKKFYLHE